MNNPNPIPDYLVRKELIDDLTFELRHRHHVSVRGPAGSGKTALLKYLQRENPFGFEQVTLLNGPELSFDASPLTGMLIGPGRTVPELILIDDFEDLVPDVVQDMVLRILKEGRKYGKQVILTNRKHMNRKAFDTNSGHVHLRGFNEFELKQYLGKYFQTYGELKQRLAGLDLPGDSFSVPLVTRMLSTLMESEDFSVDAFYKLLGRDINYENPPIIEALNKPELILPEPKKIITDIRMVNSRILDRINRNPKAVFDLQPREFEKLVAELFAEKGYQVELTQATRDGGKDLMIVDNRFGNFLIYAECKRYAPNRPVGVSIISDLVGRIEADRATAGLVITTSYFSPDAQTFTRKMEHKMSLVDYLKLADWIKNGI